MVPHKTHLFLNNYIHSFVPDAIHRDLCLEMQIAEGRPLCRFIVLQGDRRCKHWQPFEFVPKKPMEASPDLPLVQACRRNYRFLSRPISVCLGPQAAASRVVMSSHCNR